MIREFVRSILDGEKRKITESFPEDVLESSYEDEIWNGAMDLVEDLNVDLTAEKDLKFFIREGNDIVGAAFTFCNKKLFGFSIVTDPDFDNLREELVLDCLEEYDIMKSYNSDLALEIDDPLLENILISNFGFKKIKNKDRRAILSDTKWFVNDYL